MREPVRGTAQARRRLRVLRLSTEPPIRYRRSQSESGRAKTFWRAVHVVLGSSKARNRCGIIGRTAESNNAAGFKGRSCDWIGDSARATSCHHAENCSCPASAELRDSVNCRMWGFVALVRLDKAFRWTEEVHWIERQWKSSLSWLLRSRSVWAHWDDPTTARNKRNTASYGSSGYLCAALRAVRTTLLREIANQRHAKAFRKNPHLGWSWARSISPSGRCLRRWSALSSDLTGRLHLCTLDSKKTCRAVNTISNLPDRSTGLGLWCDVVATRTNFVVLRLNCGARGTEGAGGGSSRADDARMRRSTSS